MKLITSITDKAGLTYSRSLTLNEKFDFLVYIKTLTENFSPKSVYFKLI